MRAAVAFWLVGLLAAAVVVLAQDDEEETKEWSGLFIASILSSVAEAITKIGEKRQEICYDNLGCFANDIAKTLPAEPSKVGPKYFLSAAGQDTVEVSWDATTRQLSSAARRLFDRRKEQALVLIVHGFAEHGQKRWIRQMSDAAIQAYDNEAVTIAVDWRNGAQMPNYNRASANVPLISKMTVQLVQRLMSVFPTIKARNIHFVGFSLGGQMSGFFARQFLEATGERVGHVTALDAASPNFEGDGIMPRKGEAEFVEALHTSAGNSIITGKLGVIQRYGDVDFYPNGGSSQPGCALNVVCDHLRAPKLYIHALLERNSCHMKGIGCTNEKEAKDEKCKGYEVKAHLGMLRRDSMYSFFIGPYIVHFGTGRRAPYCA